MTFEGSLVEGHLLPVVTEVGTALGKIVTVFEAMENNLKRGQTDKQQVYLHKLQKFPQGVE